MLRHPSRTRLAAAVSVATIVGAAAFVAGPASAAQARTSTCDPGDFCLYYLFNRSGGLYEYSGSDSTLANDKFENTQTTQSVDNNTFSA